MAKAIIKVDVRQRTSLLEILKEQHKERLVHGEKSFSLYIDNNKRNIGYIILEWSSLKPLRLFLDSSDAKRIMSKWPVEEILEVLELRDFLEDINTT